MESSWNISSLCLEIIHLIIFFYFFFHIYIVTRSLARALEIKGITVQPEKFKPTKIIMRRATAPSPAKPCPSKPSRQPEKIKAKKIIWCMPLWCVCQRPSFGLMVSCDSPGCKIEWFHTKCINLSIIPKGNWYCAYCGIWKIADEISNQQTNANWCYPHTIQWQNSQPTKMNIFSF